MPTSREEADSLIEAYLEAYPGIAQWVDERDRFIGHFAGTELDADWQLTLRLATLWPRTDGGSPDAAKPAATASQRRRSA